MKRRRSIKRASETAEEGKVLCFISADTARELECLGEYSGKKAEDIVGWAKTETRVWQKQTPG